MDESIDTSVDVQQVSLVGLPKRHRDSWRVRPQLSRTWHDVRGHLREVLDGLAAGKKPWPLYLHGDVGVGKTRACLAFSDRLEGARYWTVQDVIKAMLAREPPWGQVWGWPFGPRLAVLDELGQHRTTSDLEYDAVKDFADWREDRPAIYVSNLPPEKMRDLYDRRVESRITCGTVFELRDRDRRRR